MNSKMCSYVGQYRIADAAVQRRVDQFTNRNIGRHSAETDGLGQICEHPTTFRKRVTCPVCKRRMKADTKFGPDAVLMWRVPPHKRKGWWKRNRHKRKKAQSRYHRNRKQ